VEITRSKLAGGTVGLAGAARPAICPPWLRPWFQLDGVEGQKGHVPSISEGANWISGGQLQKKISGASRLRARLFFTPPSFQYLVPPLVASQAKGTGPLGLTWMPRRKQALFWKQHQAQLALNPVQATSANN